MGTINILMTLLIATGISVVAYKYIVSRQRLAYDNKINIELILTGIMINLLLRFSVLGLQLAMTEMNLNGLFELISVLINSAYTLILMGIIYATIYRRVMKTEHYINRYDITIYCLCMGIGLGFSNILLVSIFGESLISTLYLISSIFIPLGYMMVMATFFVRVAEGKKGSLMWAVLLPMLIMFLDVQFYTYETFLGIFGKFFFELLVYSGALTMFFSAVRNNVQIDGIDDEAQLDRFENEKTLREKLSYRFDHFMSYGKLAITSIILLTGLLVVLVVTIIIMVETPEVTGGSISKTLWLSFMRVLDPGNVATDPSLNNSKFVVITTLATFVGLALVATYIGMVSGDFSARVEKLREGNSKVLEKKHLLFIGFCEDTLAILDNLIKFQDSKQRLDIVIVSKQSRRHVEEQIADYGLNSHRNHIICRTGDLESRNTLVNMGITKAAAVVIVGDEKEETTRIAMSVKNILKGERHKDIDIKLMTDANADLRLIRSVFGNHMKIFSKEDLDFGPVAKAGMLKEYLKLYGVLIGVDGNLVISLMRVKKCIGMAFGQVVNGFKYSSLIGLEKNGEIFLNPDKATIIEKEHQLIMLASSSISPDFIRKDRKLVLNDSADPLAYQFVKESIQNVMVIGDRQYEAFSSLMARENKTVRQEHIHMKDLDLLYDEIDRVMRETPPDILAVLGTKYLSEDENDDVVMKILAYMDAKYNRKSENYVVAALIDSVPDIKFAYELDYIDMAIENDKCRRVALELLDKDNKIMCVEEQLFEAGNRIGAVLAEGLVGTDDIKVSDVYRKCTERGLIMVGYIIREGGLINVELNPNKNDKVCFDDDDLLLVIK
jgi:hypothetical protein